MLESRRRRSVSATFLADLLTGRLAGRAGGRPLHVVDLGGGTGGLASRLAGLGHQVTVVDPSPDALASLDRRTAEAGLQGRIVGRQGDAADLVPLLGVEAADMVVCHRVLEVVESPLDALTAAAAVLRPGGVLSLLAAQRRAAVLAAALAGHLGQAREAWADPSRFDHDELLTLVVAAGLEVEDSHGIGAVAGHVAEAVLDEPGAWEEARALEEQLSQDPPFRALAPTVHVFARRPAAPAAAPPG